MGALTELKHDIRMRTKTDAVLSTAWAVAPVLAWVAAPLLFLGVFGALFLVPGPAPPGPPPPPSPMASLLIVPLTIVVAAAALLGAALFFVLMYKLIKRRNEHFRRQILLFEDVTSALREVSARSGTDINESIALCDRIAREARYEETEKSAALWVFLTLATSLAALYVMYFLMRDFYEHERREDEFWEAVSRALEKLGAEPLPKRRTPLPDRNFWLYLALSVVTFGLFSIYWWYVLIKDPNEHFKYHAVVEEHLLRELELLAT